MSVESRKKSKFLMSVSLRPCPSPLSSLIAVYIYIYFFLILNDRPFPPPPLNRGFTYEMKKIIKIVENNTTGQGCDCE